MPADLFRPTYPQISGAKLPLRPMHVWGIRVRLQFERRLRDLALFDVAIDSKLRGCPSQDCIADTYRGRMRQIEGIMENGESR